MPQVAADAVQPRGLLGAAPLSRVPSAGIGRPRDRRSSDDTRVWTMLLHGICQYMGHEEHVGADLSGRKRCRPRRMGPRAARGPVVT